MSTTNQSPIFVRIIELPPVKMARSGRGDLDAFDRWWSALDAQRKNRLCPYDFLWFNPELDNLEWLYVLDEGITDTAGYEVFDFPGGLYAVAACKDGDPETEQATQLIRQWVTASERFALAPETTGRYEMAHVITPLNGKELLGYHQLDLFIPIVCKGAE